METTFKAMDLVQHPEGELFVIQEKKPDDSGLYRAISLERPEQNALDVSDKECRKICSFGELPKAVRALVAWKNVCDRSGELGLYLTEAIQIIDQVATILDPRDDAD